MSGNPFGLSEISHFGSMQRVGGKAGGFINKKFFHPSSLRNQEKLWVAQTKAAREQRQQEHLEKQREEERQVESLRKQMYLQGQSLAGSAGDMPVGGTEAAASSAVGTVQRAEQREAHFEFKRRKAALKEAEQERGGDGDHTKDVEDAAHPTKSAPMAKSIYREDVHPLGHQSIWGSWFCAEARRWGYICCKSLKRKQRCAMAPEEPARSQIALLSQTSDAAPEGSSKRRRRAAGKAARHATEAGVAGTSSVEKSAPTGGGEGAKAEPAATPELADSVDRAAPEQNGGAAEPTGASTGPGSEALGVAEAASPRVPSSAEGVPATASASAAPQTRPSGTHGASGDNASGRILLQGDD